MLIECTLQRKEPIEVPIGNEKYAFQLDAKGRRVAEVWDERHIECFLAVPHLYRKVDDAAPADDEGGQGAMTRKDVMAALKAAGVVFNVTAKTDELVALLAQSQAQS